MPYDSNIDTGGETSVSAFIDSRADAERAVDRLVGAGVSTARIRLTGGASTRSGTGAAIGSSQERGFWDSRGDFFMPEEDRCS